MPLRTSVHYLFNDGGFWEDLSGFICHASYNEYPTTARGHMANGTPGWRVFDAESDFPVNDLGPTVLPDEGAGRIVAVAATSLARSEAWAERAVVSLAGGWARSGLRVFLMDLCLDDPGVHEVLGLPNGEGVSDAFLFGASVQRIAQPALDGAIFFASAGTATADPEQILAHPRWTDLAEGFTEADATLVLFLPASIPGAPEIFKRATDIVLLSGEDESPEDRLGPSVSKLRFSLGPERVDTAGETVSGEPVAGTSENAAEEQERETGGAETLAESEGISEEDPLAFGTFGLDGDLSGPGPDREQDSDVDLPLSLAEEFLEKEGGSEEEDALYPGEYVLGEEEASPPGIQGTMEEGPPPQFGEAAREPEREPEAEPEEFTPTGVPDFGAEFAEMPSLEGEDEAEPEELESGGDDFLPGSGYSPEAEGRQEIKGEPDSEPTSVPGATLPPEPSAEPPSARPRPQGPTPPDPARTRPMARPRPTRRRRGLRGPIVVGGGLVVVLLLAALATATGFLSVPGFGWAANLFGEVPYPALSLDGPVPVNENLRFSLQLDTFEGQELNIAVEMRNTLRGRLPGLVFNLTPVSQEESVLYLLHAGPAMDVVEAENLRGPIGEVLIREDPDGWPIRPTPRAFFLGEAGTLNEARQIVDSAEASGVLAYILQVDYADGTTGYRILSGAFDGVEEARHWQLTLRDAGYTDLPLIERRGRSPG